MAYQDHAKVDYGTIFDQSTKFHANPITDHLFMGNYKSAKMAIFTMEIKIYIFFHQFP